MTTILEDIINVNKEIEKAGLRPMDNPFAFKPIHFAGMPVYEVQDKVYPKLQLSEEFANKWLTDEAKERLNSKLISLLGVNVVKPIPEGMIYMFGGNIIARPEDITKILRFIA